MSIEERASTKYPDIDPLWDIANFEREAYIAGATEERALITTANTPPENVLNNYNTYAENAAHQSGFLIGCEWKEAQLAQQTASIEERVKELSSLYDELEANQEPIENRVILAEANTKALEADNKKLIDALAVVIVDDRTPHALIEVIKQALKPQQ